MDIEVKYKMISKIISSTDERVLNSVKLLLKIEDGEDFWDEINNEDQSAIDEALQQLDSGQHVSHQSVREEIKNKLNF